MENKIKTATRIIKGHLKEAFNMEDKLYRERIKICKECPLYKESNIGPICNPNLYLNAETGEYRYAPKEGFTKGCGCRLNAKTRLEDGHCPSGKW